MKVPYVDESKAFMQLNGRGIVRINTGDHDVLMHGLCLLHEFDHQLSADALTAAKKLLVEKERATNVSDSVMISSPVLLTMRLRLPL